MTWPNVIAANRAKKGSAAVSRRNRPPATSSTPSTRRGFAPAKSATIENNNPTAVAGDAHAYRRSRPTDLIRALCVSGAASGRLDVEVYDVFTLPQLGVQADRRFVVTVGLDEDHIDAP